MRARGRCQAEVGCDCMRHERCAGTAQRRREGPHRVLVVLGIGMGWLWRWWWSPMVVVVVVVAMVLVLVSLASPVYFVPCLVSLRAVFNVSVSFLELVSLLGPRNF